MDALTIWMLVGFLFAGYAVIANDSVQTQVHGSHQIMKNLIGKFYGEPHQQFSFILCGMVGTQTEVTSVTDV